MAKLPKEYWTINYADEQQKAEWKAAYNDLESRYRWQVDCALNNLVYHRRPWKKYPGLKCDECLDDVYILDVSHKGIGDKTVQIELWFDTSNNTLIPLYCELL